MSIKDATIRGTTCRTWMCAPCNDANWIAESNARNEAGEKSTGTKNSFESKCSVYHLFTNELRRYLSTPFIRQFPCTGLHLIKVQWPAGRFRRITAFLISLNHNTELATNAHRSQSPGLKLTVEKAFWRNGT